MTSAFANGARHERGKNFMFCTLDRRLETQVTRTRTCPAFPKHDADNACYHKYELRASKSSRVNHKDKRAHLNQFEFVYI